MIDIKEMKLFLPGFALKNVSLTVNTGEFFALLGPTGAGKTMILECIAGLRKIQSGKIKINDREITALKPEERNISIVYQDYALFPNMKVEENILYGMRFRAQKKSENVQEKFKLLIDVLQIHSLLKRYPQNLSGGEKQRVALARALLIEPDVLLLDEPFSALDVNTKESVQLEIKKLHKALKTTTLMVTHNFSEVFSLADRVAILNDGGIEQVGTTEEVFKTPNSQFTARFVGMKNIYSLSKCKEKVLLDGELEIDQDRISEKTKGMLYAGFRAEDIVVGDETLQTDYQFQGEVLSFLNNGIYTEVHIEVKKIIFNAYLTANRFFELNIYEGKLVYVGFNNKDINYIAESEKILS